MLDSNLHILRQVKAFHTQMSTVYSGNLMTTSIEDNTLIMFNDMRRIQALSF